MCIRYWVCVHVCVCICVFVRTNICVIDQITIKRERKRPKSERHRMSYLDVTWAHSKRPQEGRRQERTVERESHLRSRDGWAVEKETMRTQMGEREREIMYCNNEGRERERERERKKERERETRAVCGFVDNKFFFSSGDMNPPPSPLSFWMRWSSSSIVRRSK